MEQGVVNFEDPIEKFVPEWANMQVWMDEWMVEVDR